jgi:hypothetical protein
MSAIKPGNREPNANPLPPTPFLRGPAIYMLGVALLIGIGLLRIVTTYHVFNHTIDEGAHLACGMQWLQDHVYTYETLHPPIARVSVALLPYLAGVRGPDDPSMWQEAVLVLSRGGHYWRNLTLARIGILPYFVLVTIVVFLWTRRVYDYPTALLAAGIFTMTPVVLAHSAVATTDIPFTAFFVTALYAFTRWLSAPHWRTAAAFGIAAGLAISTKFSSLVFLPATMAAVLFLYFLAKRQTSGPTNQDRGPWGLGTVRSWIRSIVIGSLCVFLVIWTVYRFSHAPVDEFSSAPDKIAARVFGPSSSAAGAVRALTSKLQLPAPEFYDGVRFLRNQNRLGRLSYMFGQVKDGGWWYFYLVAITFKTPLAVLLLAIIGTASVVRGWLRDRQSWQRAVPLAAAVALIVVTAPSRINIGVRHILPIFAFLSMLAAVGAVALWTWGSARTQDSQPGPRTAMWAARAAVVVLFAWLTLSSALAHPDYLSYFNELGGSNPAKILVISDVDWGQDLTRLSTFLNERQIKHVSIAYVGFFDPAALGLPETVNLHCRDTATGWIAIEERYIRVYPECFQWIDSYPIKAYVGKTMRVYYLPEHEGTSDQPSAKTSQ